LAQSQHRFEADLEDLRIVWHDAAARELFARYLEPHRAEVRRVVDRLAEQLTRLREVVARMEEAAGPATDLLRFSEEIDRLRELVRREVSTVHHRVDRALDESSEARLHAEQARHSLARI
jgi:hypothetical protein